MSARILPTSSAVDAQLLSSADGHDCKCRRSQHIDKPGKDFASGAPAKKELITIDLGTLSKTKIEGKDDDKPDTPRTIYINCGSVPVEEKRYWDVTIFDSVRMRKGLYYKKLHVEESGDSGSISPKKQGGVFKILANPKHEDFLPGVLPEALAKKASNRDKKLGFRILFQPQLPNIIYSKMFNFWIDDVPFQVKLRGFSLGPAVCLTRNMINFGGVYVGNRGKHVIEMHNHSFTTARFQFPVDNARNTFKICPSSGVIQPFTTIRVEVSFHPFAARSFYKRTVCLIHHQDPIILDLVGICIPRPRFLPGPITFGVLLDQELALPIPTDKYAYYVDGVDRWGVKFDFPRIDFGYRDPDQSYPDHNSCLPLNAISSLPYDVLVEWTPDPSKVFTIAPAYGVLPSNSNKQFSVNFRPNFGGAFYDATMECYVYPIGNSWNDLGPPWKIKVPGSAETPSTGSRQTDKDENEDEDENEGLQDGSEDKVINLFEAVDSSGIEEGSSVVLNDASRKSNTTTAELVAKKQESRKSAIVLLRTSGNNLETPVISDSSNWASGFTLDSDLQGPSQGSSSDPTSPIVESPPIAGKPPVATTPPTAGSQQAAGPPVTESPVAGSPVAEAPDENVTDWPTENDNIMKVIVSRAGAEQETEFNVAPVAEDTLTSYDLPDKLFTDEKIVPKKRTLGSKASVMFQVCKSDISLNDDNNAFVGIGGNLLKDAETESIKSRKDGGSSTSTSNDSIDAKRRSTDLTSSEVVKPSKFVLKENVLNTGMEEVKTVALPLCVTLKITGHTFNSQRVPFIPNVKLPLRADMYASTPNNAVGRTILIKNLSDLPCMFDFEKMGIPSDNGLKIKPLVGLIPGNQHEIVVVDMTPQLQESPDSFGMYRTDVGVTFNLQDNCLVGLNGYCETPQLGIKILGESSEEPGSEVVFPVTIAGCVTYTKLELYNLTGFHYRFWIEPAGVDEKEWMIISPQPAQGIIGPTENVVISWRFAPKVDGIYELYWRFCIDVVRSGTPQEISLGYYEFVMPFTGVAKTSYLTSTTSALDFGLIEMFDAKTDKFTVVNDGECIVNAELVVYHQQWLANFPPETVSLSPTRVSLAPQESTEITVTVRPNKTFLQQFYVIYNVEFLHNEEFVHGAAMDVFDKHLVDIMFMGDHPTLKVIDIVMDSHQPIWDPQQCWTMFSLSLLNQYLTPVHVSDSEGHVPNIPVVKFRFPPAPIHSAACEFKLQMNNDRDLRGYWQIITTPPPLPSKNPKQRKQTHRRMSEFKDGHFVDSPDLMQRIWAKKFQNIVTSSTALNNPKDLSLFEITPTHGSLNSKESGVISIKYSFEHLGSHKISVLLRVFPTIYVWIDISGRTLDTKQPYLQFMKKEEMELHPICLSDIDPPIQLFWMYNGSNTDVTYSVDVAPFDKMKVDNFGHSVMECLTPSGLVEPRSWGAIKLRFSPLEYVKYSASLLIQPHYEKAPLQVMLHGAAEINTSVSLRPSASAENGRKFVLFSHGVPVTLSPSHITISHLIPTGHTVSRLVFLTNIHPRNPMKFYWQRVPIEGGGLIYCEPECGILSPKEEISIKVLVRTGDTAAVLSTMLTCTIEDETALVLYNFVLGQYTEYMQNTKFRETYGSNTDLVQKKPEQPEVFTRLLAISVYIGNTMGQFDNLSFKERSRIGYFPAMNCMKCGQDIGELMCRPFTYKGSQLCQSILREIIWDMVNSSCFASFMKLAMKRQAPLFEEYVEASSEGAEDRHAQHRSLAVIQASEILEKSIFNMMHEMAERYAHNATRTKWFEVPQVKPKPTVADEC